MAIKLIEFPNPNGSLPLRVAKGHFATSHSHINYYVDLAIPKYRLSEAREAARHLAGKYKMGTVVDTILCLDGTEVLGACIARELSDSSRMSMNNLKSINVVTPEHTTGSQLLFRENVVPMIEGAARPCPGSIHRYWFYGPGRHRSYHLLRRNACRRLLDFRFSGRMLRLPRERGLQYEAGDGRLFLQTVQRMPALQSRRKSRRYC